MVAALTTAQMTGRARALLLLVAAAFLGALWAATGPSGPPLYDGVGFPDEPYRYVSPPAGYQRTPPPTTAVVKAAVAGDFNRDMTYVNSGEQGPQVSLYLPDKALRVPAGSTDVTIAATPMAPTVKATSGTVEGNVYRITAQSAQGPATLTARGQTTSAIQLRAVSAQQPGPVIAVLRAGAWQKEPTTRVGNDLYQAPFTALGDYTLIRGRAATSGTTSKGSGNVALLGIVAGVIVAVMVGTILAVRHSRSRGTSPAT
jgi:hypothetical protein